MKTIKFLSITIFASALIFSCSSDDEATPLPVVEEEVITTMTITLQPFDDQLPSIILQTRDLDGDGPLEPDVNVSGNLTENTQYYGSITLLNETEEEPEDRDVTEEIGEEEPEDHQFFYTIESGLNAITYYNDVDPFLNPIGLEFVLEANAVSSGSITFTLRHEPNKNADGVFEGDITNAEGETDIEATFEVSIQ